MIETINSLLPIFAFLVATAVAAAHLYVYTKNGGNKASSEVITTYEKQVAQLKDQLATMQGKIDELTREVGKLTGIIQEKDGRMKTLEELVTARNPEMIQLIQKLSQAMSVGEQTRVSSTEYMAKTAGILDRISLFMENLNEAADRSKAILEGQEARRLKA